MSSPQAPCAARHLQHVAKRTLSRQSSDCCRARATSANAMSSTVARSIGTARFGLSAGLGTLIVSGIASSQLDWRRRFRGEV